MARMNNKGVSEVIATVLMILLTVMAVALVAAFIISFIKNEMSKKECFDAIDKISVKEGGYTFYNSTNTLVMIERAADFELKGLLVSVIQEGSSKVFEIYAGSQINGIKMYNGSSILILPKAGGAETYVFNTSSDEIKIMSILPSGRKCAEIDNKLSRR